MKTEKNRGYDFDVHATSFWHCFTVDEHVLNKIPRTRIGQLVMLFLRARYSMPVLMRLTQYYYRKSKRGGIFLAKIYWFFSAYFRRMNQVLNLFDHGYEPKIGPGVVFHHAGVCITSNTVIEPGVHIYRNVTFGNKDLGAPVIKSEAKIGSHAVVLGGVTVGRRAIVAPGSVVIKDVPDGMIAAGVPSKIIGEVTDDNYNF